MHHAETTASCLPMTWVEKIFRKLSARYGKAFAGQYDGVPIDDVMADWAEELAGLQARPEAIAHALANLPDRAPNVAQFRQLCVNAPRAAVALPPVTANPERVQAEVAKLGDVRAVHRDPKTWADAIIAEHRAGRQGLNPTRVKFAYQAKGLDHELRRAA